MVDRERLIRTHAAGFNCAQCVASYFSDRTGMDEKTALAATGGFGGGFRCGDICGAASAAIMALGLMNPYNDNSEMAKAKIAELTREFEKRFLERYEYLDCRDLRGKGHVPCGELICGAAEIVDEMLSE